MSEFEEELSTADKITTLINSMSKKDLMDLIISIAQSMPEEEQVVLLQDLLSRSLKRENTRHEVFKKISFSYRGETQSGNIQNISTSGLFIETNKDFTKGREIMMKIPFHKTSKEILVRGKIVRITPHGIGVQFSK